MDLAHLAERVEPNAPRPRLDGAFIIYWMRTAVRAIENPALDVALRMGAVLKKPVFVYHALSAHYRYASDRHHTFILEGARDVQQALRERGIGYAFHLEHPGDREPRLKQLAAEAALLVTELMPVPPMLTWDAELAKVAPLWRVDAACLAPTWLLDRPVDKASTFRAVMDDSWSSRILKPWLDVQPHHPPFLPELRFAPLELATADLPALVAGCDIDHGIAPVHHTRGGSTAGLERWESFAEERLDFYARDRADPLRDGTSRMSAYLHYGNVSPFRLARDCAEHRTDGARAFLEELLTWRELAYHFCRHHPDAGVDALPEWARTSLKKHEEDRREYLPSWEQLSRAQTGQVLWDMCQRSLLTHGELHNSLRMTWAKAVLAWTRSAPEALGLLLDLNNRYALDGRDPSSWGGVLWCLGAMDRPFEPEQPMLGRVRPRPLEEMAKRVDVGELARRSRRPSRGQALTVAVVGAGVAGAACARTLADAGHAVTVFEQASLPGGRVGTHVEGGEGHGRRFDHGAQYFTVRDERFARYARAWWHERIVTEWKPRLMSLGEPRRPPGPAMSEDSGEVTSPGVALTKPPRTTAEDEEHRLVAVPTMSALVQRMLYDIEVRCDTKVASVAREERWLLKDEQHESLGEFEALVVAAPAPDAAALIDPVAFPLAARLREVKLASCWAVMVEFPETLGVEFDAAFVHVGPLGWIARDTSRPERAQVERWMLHATPRWSDRHHSMKPADVVASLLDAFLATTGVGRVEPTFALAHHWKNARVVKPLGEPCAWDEKLRLAVCGDWCLEGRVEAAFLSGSAAAGRINALPFEGVPEPAERPIRRHAQMRLI